MCGPWLIPLALMAGGGVASYIGNQEAESAQMAASNAERQRQQAMSAQQDALVDKSIKNTSNITTGGLDAATAARKAGIQATLAGAAPTQTFLPGSSSADQSVGAAGQKIVAGEKAYTGQQADASARLNGLGDALFTTNIANNRDAQGVNQIGAAKMDSASVLPAELQAAAQKGSFLRGLGSLATTIGSFAAGGALGTGGGGNALGQAVSNLKSSMILPGDYSGMTPVVN